MRPNRLRELLNDGKPSLGTRLHNIWPGITELVGNSGMFDYVEFVAEYAPYDLHGLDNLGRAIAIYPHMTGMMKVEQQPRTYLAVRAIGAGIQNLLFADCRTAADVEECVRAVRAETPETGGMHGCGLRRDAGYVIDVATPAYVQALEDAVVAIMIEKREAVENLDSVLAVKGVDMVQFGPGDYSMSIGVPGQFNHPRVREAETYVIETALAAGLQPRAEIGSPEEAQRYLEMGVRHFNIGSDMSILYRWFCANGKAMSELLGTGATAGEDAQEYPA
ncbi:MAG TPA: aldolase/citrate lyase family protein [Thermomicrobiales bacterium]|nr:aldolase/citrate lyase family protein [Thermomicrobiales bacterium]